MSRIALLVLAATLISCASAPPPTKTIKHTDLVVDGEKRLTDDVVPTNYGLELTIDPSKDKFQGVVKIDIVANVPTQVIYLHAEDMTIKSGLVELKGKKGTVSADAGIGENGGLAVILGEEISGEALLVLEYEGNLKQAPTGLYRVQDKDNWYAFTQFEPLEARQAFPSFDEPRFKTPFTSTVTVPTGLIAASNTPELKKTENGAMTTFSFAKTKPLPTYLVAYAVGDFDIVAAEEGAIPGVPFRIITTKGKGKYADFMLKRTPKLVELLLEYFGGEFPYAKLDFVAVPNFSAGAMENVGLVTFREKLLLLDNETASAQDRRAALSVTAHELAHMWFGNLVTMPWWDDLWLNESFATWMASRILDQVAPQLENKLDDVRRTQGVLENDGLANARQIRQPIEKNGDIYNAFDGITYRKGAAVIRMIETWVGPEALQKGVQDYLKKNAHGSGSTADFLASVDAASGKKVSEVFTTYLDQPGAPLIQAEVVCTGKPSVRLTQTRYTSSPGEPVQQSWKMPVCIRYADGKGSEVHCDMLRAKTSLISLPAKSCPAWIHPNADEVGYYRWTMADDAMKTLATKHLKKLNSSERLGLFGNLQAMTRSQRLPADVFLAGFDAFLDEDERPNIQMVLGAISNMDRFVAPEQRKAWEKKVARLTKKKARKLGFKAKGKEQPTVSMLRSSILMANAKYAADSKTIKDAGGVTDEFFSDMDSVTTDVLYTALPISAWNGDASMWLKYKMGVQQAPPGARRPVLRGLGSFRDADLHKKSLDLLLDGTLRSQDMWSIIGPSFERDETFATTWAWFTANYDKIVELIGKKSAGGLPWVGTGFCTPEGKKIAEDFFSKPEHQAPGSERNLKNALEVIDLCIAQKQYLSPSLAEYLK